MAGRINELVPKHLRKRTEGLRESLPFLVLAGGRAHPRSERNIMLRDSTDNTIDHEKEFGVYEGLGIAKFRPDGLADINVVLRAEFDTFNEAFAEAIRIFENELFEGERKLVLIMRGDEVVWDCSEGQTGDPEVIDMQVQLRH